MLPARALPLLLTAVWFGSVPVKLIVLVLPSRFATLPTKLTVAPGLRVSVPNWRRVVSPVAALPRVDEMVELPAPRVTLPRISPEAVEAVLFDRKLKVPEFKVSVAVLPIRPNVLADSTTLDPVLSRVSAAPAETVKLGEKIAVPEPDMLRVPALMAV